MASALATNVVETLYGLYREGDNVEALLSVPIGSDETAPPEVVAVLTPRNLVFEQLPRTLQLALLWDSGYVMTVNGFTVAIRVQCGLSLAVALDHSTFALPTCAISTPVEGVSDESMLAWLRFDDESSLPSFVDVSTFDPQSRDPGAMIPCTTNPEVTQALCLPERDPILGTWLQEYEDGPKRDLSSYGDSSSYFAMPANQPVTTPAQSPILDRTVAAIGSSVNVTFTENGDMGLSSDFASVFYAFRASGGTLPRLELLSKLPADIQARLEGVHLKFESLTGMLQRALLWDSGYVLVQNAGSSIAVNIVPVYVKCGLRMSDLALDRGYFETTGCPVRDCSTLNITSGDRILSYRAGDCIAGSNTSSSTGADLKVLSRCAIASGAVNEMYVPVASSSTAWAIGNISASERDRIPNLWLQQQPNSDSSASRQYAIHSASIEVPAISCPHIPSFIIPCVTVDQPNLQQDWCRPIQTELVKTWIQQEQHQEMALATLILLAGAILLALALDLFADRKPRFFRNGRVSATSVPSLTSTILDGIGDQSQTIHSDRTGWSSLRSARSVRSNR